MIANNARGFKNAGFKGDAFVDYKDPQKKGELASTTLTRNIRLGRDEHEALVSLLHDLSRARSKTQFKDASIKAGEEPNISINITGKGVNDGLRQHLSFKLPKYRASQTVYQLVAEAKYRPDEKHKESTGVIASNLAKHTGSPHDITHVIRVK